MSDSPIDAIDLYWRPGCGFCMSLDRKLTKAGIPMRKHNIWEDPADAATVRSIANGNETVPTVVVGAASMVNPGLRDVLAALASEAPHLVPDDVDPSGPIGRLSDRLRNR